MDIKKVFASLRQENLGLSNEELKAKILEGQEIEQFGRMVRLSAQTIMEERNRAKAINQAESDANFVLPGKTILGTQKDIQNSLEAQLSRKFSGKAASELAKLALEDDDDE